MAGRAPYSFRKKGLYPRMEGINRDMRQIFNGTNALKAKILLMSLVLSGVISLTFNGNGMMPGH